MNFTKRVFRLAASLAFVRMHWPHGAPETAYAEPVEVASVIHRDTPFKQDGRKPSRPAKVEALAHKKAAIDALAEQLRATVKANLEGRDLYAFTRHTHETLARAVAKVHPDNVNAQIGHSGGGMGEKFYLDRAYLDPSESSQAVYNLIQTHDLHLNPDTRKSVISMAAVAENTLGHEVQCEVVDQKGQSRQARRSHKSLRSNGAISGIRTQDLCFTKALLYR